MVSRISYLLLISFLLLCISCGEDPYDEDDRSNQFLRSLSYDESQKLTSNEYEQLKEVCSAFEKKSAQIELALLNTPFSLVFEQSEKKCVEDEAQDFSEHRFFLKKENDNIILMPNDEVSPLFNFIETNAYGNLKDYCENMKKDSVGPEDLMNGSSTKRNLSRQIANGAILRDLTFLGRRSKECEGSELNCLKLNFALRNSSTSTGGNTTYSVNQVLYLGVDLTRNSEFTGFVRYKKLYQKCSNKDEFMTKTMRLGL